MVKFYTNLCAVCLMAFGFLLFHFNASAVVVTINATGITGSYRTGSVNSSGTKNDGNMVTINSSSNRGFASFDLSTIPSGAIINSVSVVFTTYTSTSSTATNNIYGFTGDPSVIAGATLYTNAGSGTSFNNTSWTANAANTKALNASGVAFIQANVGGSFVNLGFVRGSTNTYNIYGYPGTTAQQPALTIDYTVPVPCAGPVGPVTITAAANACIGVAFNITSSGIPAGTSGISLQWQTSAPSVNAFTNVATGGTSATLAVTSQTSATDYRLRIICTNTNDTTYSNTLAIGQNPFYNCYCTPASTCTNEGIANVDFNNGAINNASAFCANTSGYTDYASLGATATVTQAQVVPIAVTGRINSNPASAGVWIDFDHSGTFDAGEYTSLGSSSGIATLPANYVYSGSIAVPATALTGITRMRVRQANQGGITATSACTNSGVFGEYEDYLITINAGTACSGTPSAGSITGAPATVCPNVDFVLTASGFTNGVTGLTYLWEIYNTATSSWGPAPGTNNGITYTANIATPSDFRFTVTCTNGNGTSSSTPVSVAVTSFTQCYCIPTNTTNTSYFINDFTTTGGLTNISNTGSGLSTGSYGNFTSQVVSVLANGSFTYNATYTTGSTFGTKVWVDWNHNGLFTDAGEQVYATTSYSNTSTATITVPAGALTGPTRMRIGQSFTPATGPANSCVNNLNGEYEDYTVDVIALIPCSGTPVAGTAVAPATVCPGVSFNLQASGFTTGTGLTVQWEESPSGAGMWSSITNATTASYSVSTGITSATDYRMRITCANGGGNDVTNTVTIGIDPFYNCYCTPASNCTNEGIQNVTFDLLNNSSTYCTNANGYSNFASLGALATVSQAQIATISVTGRVNSNPASVGVWIDYDHSGTFDTTEYTLIGTSTGVSPLPTAYIYSGNISISPTAQTGITRMRVRQANQSGIANNSACTNTGVYGEYEDYLINITTSNNCFGTPTAGSVTAPSNVCANTGFTLSTTGTTTGVLGLAYEWQQLNTSTNTWVPASGTNTNATYTIASGITAATDYRLKVTCTNGGGFDISAPVSIGISPASQCYCIPGGTNSSYYINDFSTSGGVKNISKTGTGFATGGYGNYTTTDTVAVAASGIFNINAAFGSGTNTFGVKIWIDYDGDGIFNQTNEQVYVSGQYYNTFSTAITIPASTAPITTRMRVGISFTPNSGPASPCASISGEFEDYTINILPAPSCLPSTVLNASNLASSSARLSWNTIAGAAGYEYVVNQSSTAPSGSGTQTTDTFYNATGLPAATTHYLHVRTNCGATYSPWVSYSFFTTAINDSCVNALPVPWTGTISGDNLYATDDALPAVTCGSATTTTGTYHGLWYTVTPIASGSLTIGACTNTFDTYMRIYEGTCGSFTACAGFDDDACPTNAGSLLTFNAVANTTYYVLLGTYGSGSSPNNGTFTLTVTGLPLAIKLDKISATNVGSRNRVDWITAEENKGDRFEVESSADGKAFRTIGNVAATGQPSSYTLWDETPVNGVNYYRVKMTDASGNSSYSQTVIATVKANGSFRIQAYPNPVKDMLTVTAQGTDAKTATVHITDISGKVMRTITMTDGLAEIDMKGLAQGFYLVKYTDGSNSQTLKVTKQ